MTKGQFLSTLKIKMTSDPLSVKTDAEINEALKGADQWFRENIEGEIPPDTHSVTEEDGKTVIRRRRKFDPLEIR